jgi:hypothetical protein
MYVEKETPVTGTGRGSQRYSTPSNELNIEDEKVFSTPGSRKSVVNGSL